MKYLVKTKAVMEQSYNIEAESEEEAKSIALANTQEIVEQTQIDAGEVLSCEQVAE